jgi:hypothetical protein
MAGSTVVDENGNPIAAPGASSNGRSTVVDEEGNPVVSLQDRVGGALTAAQPWADIGTRTGVRVMTAPMNAWVTVPKAIGWAAEKLGMHFAPQPPPLLDTNGQPVDQSLPSEAIIKQLGVEAPPDQTPAQQMTESVAPFLVPTSNTISRVQEAPGVLNKIYTGVRSEGASVADWLAANAAQEWAKAHGYSDEAQQVAGALGPTGRNLATRTGGAFVRLFGKSGGGESFDVNRKIDVTPPLSSVAGPSLANTEEALGDLPFFGAPIRSARKAQSDAIAERANRGLQTISPGTTDITEAGPGSMNAYAEQLGQQAREKLFNEETALKVRADRIETPIANVPVQARPVIDLAQSIIDSRGVSDDVSAAANVALQKLLAKVDPDTGLIEWSALKQTRSALGPIVDNMFQSASPTSASNKRVVGAHLDQIGDAMTQALGEAADQAGHPEWRQLDADWTAAGRRKADLADVGGTLERVGPTMRESAWSSPSSTEVGHKLNAAVKGEPGYLDAIDRGFHPATGNRAIAETIAAKARPQSGTGSGEFRPDVLATRSGEIGNQVRSDLRSDPVSAQGLQDIEDAIAAAQTTVKPRTTRGLGEKLGALATAVDMAGTVGGGIFRPISTGLGHLAVSSLEDPSFIRSVAGRGVTPETINPLMQQYLTRGGLGAVPQPPDIIPRVKNAAMSAPGSVLSALLPYLQQVVR